VPVKGSALPILRGITQRRKSNYNRKARTAAGVWRCEYLWTNCVQQLGDTKKYNITYRLKYIKL